MGGGGGAMGGLAPLRISLAPQKVFYLEAKNAKIQAWFINFHDTYFDSIQLHV